MKKNEQLYISRCMVDEEFKKHRCTNYKECKQTKPHKQKGLYRLSRNFFHICDCIPVPLEYYIEKVLNNEK